MHRFRSRSPILTAVFRLVMSADRAASVLGDLEEERARRRPRWPRVWFAVQAALYLLAAIRTEGPRSLRSGGVALRDAWRSIRATPASTGFVLLVLTAAIAAATVTFSVVDHVVLRPLPFPDDDELVVVESRGVSTIAPVEYLAWRDRVDGLAGVAAVQGPWPDEITIGTAAQSVVRVSVAGSLFDVLAVRPRLGTVFTAAHEVDGRGAVAVISDRLWRRHFAATPDVIGRTVRLREGPFTILGVMPPGFGYPVGRAEPVDLWTPYAIPDDERTLAGSGIVHNIQQVVGRVRPGATLEQVQSQLDVIAADFVAARPRAFEGRGPMVRPLQDALVGQVSGWMLLALWAVALVMAVACVNVANLMLSRSAQRTHELSVRAALGAGRRQLMATLLVESVLLSMAATGLAVLLALWGAALAKTSLPGGIARTPSIAVDGRVLLVTLAAGACLGILFGGLPAWLASRADLVSFLKSRAAGMATRSRPWRTGFLVLQLAFVGVLLVAVTLFVGSFARIVQTDLGFDRIGLIVVAPVPDPDVGDALRAIPGVTRVSAVANSSPPLIGSAYNYGFSSSTTLRRTDAPADAPPVGGELFMVEPGYFETAGIPIIAGRTLRPSDLAPDEVVLDELLAARLFGTVDAALGATVLDRGNRPLTVAGIARSVGSHGPEADRVAQLYRPLPDARRGVASHVVRTDRPVHQVLPLVRDLVGGSAGARGTTPGVFAVEDAFRVITADRRFVASVMSVFGLLALFIGAAGVYGVMASIVSQQMREMGVRVALGATTRQIIGGVLGQTGRYLCAGLAIGLFAAFWVSQVFASLLFEVQPTDPVVYAIVAGLLLAVGLAAAWLPARRAGRVDPIALLRTE